MAISGSGDRPTGRKRQGSGNRRPAQPAAGGRSSGGRGSSDAGRGSAQGRARERLQQQPAGRQGGRGAGGQRQARGPRPGARPPRRRGPQQRRRSTAVTAGIFGGAFVVLVAVVIIAVSLLAGGKAGPGHDPYVKARPAPAAISSAVQNVPVSALKAAGNGATTGADAISPVGKAGSGYPIIPLSGKALTRNGKPLVVYLGAEYCPYCAATRWPLTIALSRFGTFSGLQITASTPLDVYSSTHTLSYATAKYHSQYLTFDSTEELTNICPKGHVIVNTQRNAAQPDWISPPYICNTNYEPLQTPSKAVSQLLSSVDTAANFTTSGASGIPFIDFGGKYAESGSIYSPALLHGADWSQIVASLKAPTRGIGHAVLAAANRYTAILCQVTGDTPASVCDAPFMKSAEKALAPK